MEDGFNNQLALQSVKREKKKKFIHSHLYEDDLREGERDELSER